MWKIDSNEYKNKPISILSIDGGGVRGLFAVKILQEIQKHLLPSNRPINDYFQVKSGTSTGSIIAAALSFKNAKGYAFGLDDLETLYHQESRKIFYRSCWYRMLSLNGLLSSKYKVKNLQHFLDKSFGDHFLSTLEGTVFIPTFSDDHGHIVTFNNQKAKRDFEADFYIKDVVRAATAAETYFPPTLITNKAGQSFCFGDAGIVVNNPEVLALLGAMETYPTTNTFIVLSIGTGEAKHSFNYQKLKREGGLIDWLQQGLISASMDGESKLTSSIMKQLKQVFLSRNITLLHTRFQYNFDQEVIAMDDASPTNLQRIMDAAHITLKAQQSKIREIVALLNGN